MVSLLITDPMKLSKKNEFTFSDVLEKYISLHLPTIRKTTAIRYQTEIEHRLKPAFKHFRLSAISWAMIIDFRAKISGH